MEPKKPLPLNYTSAEAPETVHKRRVRAIILIIAGIFLSIVGLVAASIAFLLRTAIGTYKASDFYIAACFATALLILASFCFTSAFLYHRKNVRY